MHNVALLIPAFNCEAYVEATLASILVQHPDLSRIDRVILSDDCSTDQTVNKSRTAWTSDVPFEILESRRNRGEYKNVNEAVASMPPYIEWFLIIHADNLAKEGWLSTLLDRIDQANDRIGSICTSWDDLHEDGRITPGERRESSTPERIYGNKESVRSTLLRGCWWHISSCAIRVSAYREIGGLPLGLRLKGDWDFLLRLLGAGWDIEYVPVALMKYRTNPAGSSSLSFRRHNDVIESLTVLQRHDSVLKMGDLVRCHLFHLRCLGRRFVGAMLRGRWERMFRAITVSVFVIRSFAKCSRNRWLGRRRFDWVSSVDPAAEARLTLLSSKMARFYRSPITREAYQKMVDSPDSAQPETERMLREWVIATSSGHVLEVGCGSGRIYKRLRGDGFRGYYTGVEMAPHVIDENKKRFTDACWICGSGYSLPVSSESQECAFAYYVLEHCAFPERLLKEMLRIITPGGSMILTFPAVVQTGIFGSQALGLAEGNAREHVRSGRWLSALIGLWDSRVRLPWALRRARRSVGVFPVNLRPKCLNPGVIIQPDVDAIYAASRDDIVEWARNQGIQVRCAEARNGSLHANVLIELKKPVATANDALHH